MKQSAALKALSTCLAELFGNTAPGAQPGCDCGFCRENEIYCESRHAYRLVEMARTIIRNLHDARKRKAEETKR